MQPSKRKKILIIFLVIDVVVLLLLTFIYFQDVQKDLNTEVDGVVGPSQQSITQQSSRDITITINPTYVDTYLSNPGIGWQDDFNEDIGYLPETVSYSDRKDISWDILNPADGLYDWSALDKQKSLAVASGRLFSFRIYTMAGESFGGHKVPSWVLEKGAKLLSTGEPDYSNCVYQEEWGRFVQELVNRYDGNKDIAFIDISGYGNFNEWSWQDEQTRWDELWDQSYTDGTATPSTFRTIDGQARRRLADMFIGGTIEGHKCLNKEGVVQTVNYSYKGFDSTQLVMPFAGIVQSTQYVFLMRPDIGFRYDSLGRSNPSSIEKISSELSTIWQKAPVVFELSKPEEFKMDAAFQLIQFTHASLVHNNDYQKSREELQQLISKLGYRYFLKKAQFNIQPRPEGEIDFVMHWQNVGIAPNYPRMGQIFELHVYLVDKQNSVVVDNVIPGDISSWMPPGSMDESPPDNIIKHVIYLPEDISPGVYNLEVSILDVTTDRPINLAFYSEIKNGRYWLTDIDVGVD